MDSISTTGAREHFAKVLNLVTNAKDRVRITYHGKQVAAMVPIEDLEFLERLEDEIDIREAQKVLADPRDQGAIPWEDAKKELER